MELAAWERGQREFSVTTAKALSRDGELVSLGLKNGRGLKVPMSLHREQIYQAIRKDLPHAHPPDLSDERGPVPVESSSHEIWSELLEDLGAYDHLLRGTSPMLGLTSVYTDGLQARITLTDGDSSMDFTYALEGGEVPFGLAIELATDFLNHVERH